MTGATAEPDLAGLWEESVRRGEISNRFRAARSDPAGRWREGDWLAFGLRLDDGVPRYTASNLTTGLAIEAAVEERPLPGTDFVCQFNGYRALRPRTFPAALGRQPDIPATAAECRFFCADPANPISLRNRRPLYRHKLRQRYWNAYYNAIPFEARGHLLWVPSTPDPAHKLPHLPQILNSTFVKDLLALAQHAPSWRFSYSSLHAGASVNHFHAQSVLRTGRLAIDSAAVREDRGFHVLSGYPAEGFVFDAHDSADLLALTVDRLQARSLPFNLHITHPKAYLFVRNPDHEIVAEFPADVLAATDLSGKVITSSAETYASIDAKRITQAISKTCLDAAGVIPVLLTANT
jgi:hypothetical protein